METTIRGWLCRSSPRLWPNCSRTFSLPNREWLGIRGQVVRKKKVRLVAVKSICMWASLLAFASHSNDGIAKTKCAVRMSALFAERWPRFKMLTDLLLLYPSQRCSWVQPASSATAPSICGSRFPEEVRFSSFSSPHPWSSYSSMSWTLLLWLRYCLKTSWSWCLSWS